MSIAELSILNYLRANPDRLTTSLEISDECGLKTDLSVKVLVHRLRAKGHEIVSKSGPYGGYRLGRSA
jgi:DNA-binding IscR family transcriptional regulator